MSDDEADNNLGIELEEDERSKRDRFISGDDEGENDESETQPAPKRLRVSEPDVLVKVGDQQFEHYSILLCAASPYFDAMLSIDMKERLSGKIEFLDKNPKDWESLVPYLEPHAPPLTLKKIQQLLPWFHELQMDALLEKSDQYLNKKVLDTRDAKIKGDVHEFISILELSDKYSLQETREAALEYLEDCIRKGHIILGSGGVARLVPFLRVRETLWDAIKKHLPEEFRNSNKEELLKNPLFSFVVSSRWRLRAKKKEHARRNVTPRVSGRRLHGAMAPFHMQEQENIANVQEAVAAAVEHIQREFENVEQQHML